MTLHFDFFFFLKKIQNQPGSVCDATSLPENVKTNGFGINTFFHGRQMQTCYYDLRCLCKAG